MIDPVIKKKIFHGSLWSLCGSSGQQIFGFVVFVVISQQLSPKEFGAIAIAMVLLELFIPLINMGLGQVVVKQKNLSEEVTSTIFWIQSFIGIVLGLSMYFGSGVIAFIYNAEEIETLIKILAVAPVMIGFCGVHVALLQRDMEFKKLASRELLSTLISGGFAIALVFYGWGVYSLVAQRLVKELVILLLLWRFVRWRPQATFSQLHARYALKLGLPLMMSSLVMNLTRRIVESLIGLFFGLAVLGCFRLAAKLQDFVLKFTVSPIVTIALPAFSHVQHNSKSVQRSYRRFVQIASLIAAPAFLGLAVISEELIIYVFGEQWKMASELLHIMCFSAIFSTINYFYKPLMVNHGKTSLILRLNIFELVVASVFTIIMAKTSISIIMGSYVLANILIMILAFIVIEEEVGIPLRKIFSEVLPSILSAMLMYIFLIMVKGELDSLISGSQLLSCIVAIGIILYFSILFLIFPKYVEDIKKSVIVVLKKKDGNGL